MDDDSKATPSMRSGKHWSMRRPSIEATARAVLAVMVQPEQWQGCTQAEVAQLIGRYTTQTYHAMLHCRAKGWLAPTGEARQSRTKTRRSVTGRSATVWCVTRDGVQAWSSFLRIIPGSTD